MSSQLCAYAGVDGVRVLVLREVGILGLWRLRRASRACKDWAEEALGELPKLAMLNERCSNRTDLQSQPWELVLHEMSWRDWSCTSTVLPMPPAVEPRAALQLAGDAVGDGASADAALQRAVAASQLLALGPRPRRTGAMWAALDGGDKIFCGGGKIEWGEDEPHAWGRLGGMGDGGCIVLDSCALLDLSNQQQQQEKEQEQQQDEEQRRQQLLLLQQQLLLGFTDSAAAPSDALIAAAKPAAHLEWDITLPPLPLPLCSAGCFSVPCNRDSSAKHTGSGNSADEAAKLRLALGSETLIVVGGEGEESYSTATFMLEGSEQHNDLDCSSGSATAHVMGWRNSADVPGSVFFGGAVSLGCATVDAAGGLLVGTMWSHARSCIRCAAYDPLNESWSSRPTPERLCSPVFGCVLGLPAAVERGADGHSDDGLGSRSRSAVLIISGDGYAWLYQGAGLMRCRQACSPPQHDNIQAVANVAGGAVLVCTDTMYLYDASSDSWRGPLPAAVGARAATQRPCGTNAHAHKLEHSGDHDGQPERVSQAEKVLLLYSRLGARAAPGRTHRRTNSTAYHPSSWQPSVLTGDFNDE